MGVRHSFRVIPAISLVFLTSCGTLVPSGGEAQPPELPGVAMTDVDRLFFANQRPVELLSRIGLGVRPFKVSTSSAEAQAYVDQGLAQYYDFDFAAAWRSFRKATQIDDGLAMAYGLAAFTLISGNNFAATDYRLRLARSTVESARKHVRSASKREADYITAFAACIEASERTERTCVEPFASVSNDHPDDPVASLLWVHGKMWFNWWSLYTRPGRAPRPGAQEVIDRLAAVLQRDPGHPGALHMWIHLWEQSNTPEVSLDAARRLHFAAPIAAHFAHMPGHTYTYAGEYATIATLNHDVLLMLQEREKRLGVVDLYNIGESSHAIRYDAIYAAWAGRSQASIRSIELLLDRYEKYIPVLPWLELIFPNAYIPLVQLKEWDYILGLREPAADLLIARGWWHWARGMAQLGKRTTTQEAEASLRELQKVAGKIPEDAILSSFNARQGFAVAEASLEAAIARNKGDIDSAIRYMEHAASTQDELAYEEPELIYPMANCLGWLYLEAGRPRQAADAFVRGDLRLYRSYGPALLGLSKAREALGDPAGASETRRRFESAWKLADVPLSRVAGCT